MKMLKVMALLSLLMLVVSCGGSTGATGAAKKYIIATDATYAPFEFQENGKYIGIDVDLITEIAKAEGFEFELKPMDFGGIIPALQSGQIDGAIAGASITDERKKSVDFAGFIAFNKEGQEIFTFGKHKGVLVDDVLEKEPGYFSWLQNADFPLYTKKVLTGIKLRKLNTK